MADNLVSADRDSDTIYTHDGFSTTILDSIAAPASDITSITWDGTYLYSCDHVTNLIYKHDGFTTTILDSIAAPSSVITGLTIDAAGNLYSVDDASKLAYMHDGFSTTILDSFTVPGTVNVFGITTDGPFFYVYRGFVTNFVYKLDGFSDTVLDTFTVTAGEFGLTTDGTDIYNSDQQVDEIYHRDGFSSTKLETITSPSTFTNGLTWGNFDARVGPSFIPKFRIR